MFSWMILISIIWFIIYVVYIFSKVMDKREGKDKSPEIHVHYHPVRREIYVMRIIERKDSIYLGS